MAEEEDVPREGLLIGEWIRVDVVTWCDSIGSVFFERKSHRRRTEVLRKDLRGD
jgi:hypothetical protein